MFYNFYSLASKRYGVAQCGPVGPYHRLGVLGSQARSVSDEQFDENCIVYPGDSVSNESVPLDTQRTVDGSRVGMSDRYSCLGESAH